MEGLGLKEKERIRPLKMDGPRRQIEDVETKDENGNRNHYRLHTNSNMVHIDDVTRAHIFVLEHSNAKGRYPKQEMGSEKGLYSKVLSLDNASEMNNELHLKAHRSITSDSATDLQQRSYDFYSPTLIKSQFVENKRHDNYDLQSYFAIVEESRRNQSDEAKENGNGKRVVEDASHKLAESRHEIENIQSFS
ncbi:hypothetical protein SADUNF_Sadunf18G0048400 [Salix dunnii]|uniref:Uncharacterized protein n=1 Tax=Salix dunnii TaxID=1413687 RepID=A0A835MIR4_9ROSI|nr:hypothetical protein SADUNF_Sadunf18G0048400 [Salix dunnii]